MNALVFDNGFHTVHHERPGLHWSRLRTEHAKIAHHLEPRCVSPSIFHYAVETYLLSRLRGRAAGISVP
jgi:fatty acid desaturase